MTPNEEKRFNAVYTAHTPEIIGYARRRGFTDDAEDIAQTTMTELFCRWPKIDTTQTLRPLIYKIARDVMYKVGEKSRRSPVLISCGTSDDVERLAASRSNPPHADSAAVDRVSAALEALSAAQRRLLWLIYIEGRTSAEVAATLNVTAVAVRKRLSRIYDALRKHAKGLCAIPIGIAGAWKWISEGKWLAGLGANPAAAAAGVKAVAAFGTATVIAAVGAALIVGSDEEVDAAGSSPEASYTVLSPRQPTASLDQEHSIRRPTRTTPRPSVTAAPREAPAAPRVNTSMPAGAPPASPSVRKFVALNPDNPNGPDGAVRIEINTPVGPAHLGTDYERTSPITDPVCQTTQQACP